MNKVRVGHSAVAPPGAPSSAAPRASAESPGQSPGKAAGKGPGPVPGAAPGAAARLGWLDALRGFAALAVVFQHTGPYLLPGVYRPSHQQLDAGIFGVFLFFLISGYIVPASLERRGDLRAFWTGRVFRIYPLYLVVFLLALLSLPRAYAGVGAGVFQHPWLSAAADGVLLQDLLGVQNGLAVSWTLCYEMVFYYLVSALFLLRLHRRSVPIAVVFAATALLLGGVLPTAYLVRGPGEQAWLVGTVLVVVVAATGAILGGRTVALRVGVAVLGLLGLLLLVFNSRSAVFESMMILATMFTGTVIQRAESGQINRWYAAACCAFVFLAGLASGLRFAGQSLNRVWTTSADSWCTAFVAAWLVFGLGMLLLRGRRVPRALCRLGTLSYALYLLHVPLLSVAIWILNDTHYSPARHPVQELLCEAAFLAVALLLAEALHRLVELPGQRLGRGLLRRSEARAARRASRAVTG
ncbi:acyltransferase [Streptacidiphilus sp. P02-A3a]|uniref:acyltransferase family protein n=1 Tax=Streptacidiphilus sp. P02-A3a TaxID=2704468 RepID=UPI0015FBBCC0|nr:acyltransferase [Streptacidiphilus sp. P02-A3a]QMU68609.1 acyltransferase [Streptacidiphilus sp. P02-A3a]